MQASYKKKKKIIIKLKLNNRTSQDTCQRDNGMNCSIRSPRHYETLGYFTKVNRTQKWQKEAGGKAAAAFRTRLQAFKAKKKEKKKDNFLKIHCDRSTMCNSDPGEIKTAFKKEYKTSMSSLQCVDFSPVGTVLTSVQHTTDPASVQY